MLESNGGRGRNRIINQTYFQQHAGRRMTPKAVESSRKPINRAHIERTATKVLAKGCENVNQVVSRSPHLVLSEKALRESSARRGFYNCDSCRSRES